MWETKKSICIILTLHDESQWFFLLLLTTANSYAKDVTIKGEILNGNGKYIYLQTFQNDKNILVDSTIINKKGIFKMSDVINDSNFKF